MMMMMMSVEPTPISTTLFCKSDNVVLSEDKYMECDASGPIGAWHQIGINHVLNKDKTTKWSIKCESNNVSIGVGSKGVLESTNGFTGWYMYGWVFLNCGIKCHFGQQEPYGDHLRGPCTLRWANGDKITLQYHDYTLTLFINDFQVSRWRMKKYPNLDDVDLYPVINLKEGKAELISFTEE